MSPEFLGRICLVDDNAEFRESAVWWLESLGYEVCAFGDPDACLEAAGDGSDWSDACLLLDVRMPQMSGLQLMDALRKRGVAGPVIFMTGHGDVPLAVEAMRKGAVTFLEKPFREEALEEALDAAFSSAPGSMPVPHPVGALRAAAREPTAALLQQRFQMLTDREREILEQIVAGESNKGAAVKLGISHKTVELHRARAMVKLGVANVAQLVRLTFKSEAS